MPFTNHNASLSVFIVEDNEWYRRFIEHTIALNPSYVVKSFATGKELLDHLHLKPDVISLDYHLPDYTGDALMQAIRQQVTDIDIIVVSEQEDIETAIGLIKNGAYDYIVKTKDIKDRMHKCLQNICDKRNLNKRISVLEEEVGKKYEFSKTLVGASQNITRLFPILEKAAGSLINVTITGETGTGKEVVAKSIHYQSARKNKPFVAINIAAIPATLIESELFGFEKGAFTGANSRRMGKFEEAHGGTLFLDEIGEMDQAVQVKLLRAIQEKEIVRIGGNNTVHTDCRIIVATHRNLLEEVSAGRFRQDLYYRLFGLTIAMPPLRERGKDILILAKHFLDLYAHENKQPTKSIAEAAQLKLMSYAFPGNVRELKSVMELAFIMSNSDTIAEDDILLSSADVISESISEELTMKAFEQRILKTYLSRYDNNIKIIAQKLDISQSTIYRMLKEMGL